MKNINNINKNTEINNEKDWTLEIEYDGSNFHTWIAYEDDDEE